MSAVRRSLMNAKGGKELPNYLCFTALEPSTIKIGISGSFTPNIEYSNDGFSFTAFTTDMTLSINTDKKIYLRGSQTRMGTNVSSYSYLIMTGRIAASGNIMSLLYKEDFDNVKTLPNTMTFTNFFKNCTALVTPPELPATTTKVYCYQSLFEGCSNLEDAPELPAILGSTGVNSAYRAMFKNTKITKAPKLLSTTLSGSSTYREMFQNCTKLNWVMCLAINITGTDALTNWMSGVQNNSGIFVKHIDAQWTTTGNSGVPTNWTIIYYDPAVDKYYTDQTKATECDDHGNPI